MSGFILDTDTLSLFEQGHPVVCQKILARGLSELAITVISVEEQLSGWYTALRQARRTDELVRVYQHITDTIKFFSNLEVISFSASAVAVYERLKKQRLNVSKMDVRIAAIALEREACIVTRNTRDFCRISGLQVTDWSS